MSKRHKRLLLSAIFSCMLASVAEARQNQFNFRTGMIYGDYQGPIEGDFFVPNTIDIDYSSFLSSNTSLNFRATLALEFPESKPLYTYAGVGMRFFRSSKGIWFDQEEAGLDLQITPTRRYYIGFDVGVSQAIIESFGTVLQAVSGMVDVGAMGGAIWQINKRLGIEAQFGVSLGFGFTSVGVVGTTWRGLIGTNYSF